MCFPSKSFSIGEIATLTKPSHVFPPNHSPPFLIFRQEIVQPPLTFSPFTSYPNNVNVGHMNNNLQLSIYQE